MQVAAPNPLHAVGNWPRSAGPNPASHAGPFRSRKQQARCPGPPHEDCVVWPAAAPAAPNMKKIAKKMRMDRLLRC
jgi:hypothetical protein